MPKDRFESIDFEKVSKLKAKNESSRKKPGVHGIWSMRECMDNLVQFLGTGF